MTFAVVIPSLFLVVSLLCQGEVEDFGLWDWYFLALLIANSLIYCLLMDAPVVSITKGARPPPVPNIYEFLGSAYPWRCSWTPRKRQPYHYFLVMKIWRRTRLRLHGRKRHYFPQWSVPPARTVPDPAHWRCPSDAERLDDWDRLQHRFLHSTYFQYTLRFGVSLDQFVSSIDPLHQFHLLRDFQLLVPLSRPVACGNHHGKMDFSQHFQTAAKLNSIFIAAFKAERQSFLSRLGLPVPIGRASAVTNSVRQHGIYFNHQDHCPIVIDTGASVSLTPFKSDFVGPIKSSDIPEMQGLSAAAKVAGKGKVKWTVRDLFGRTKTIFTEAYYVPDATQTLQVAPWKPNIMLSPWP
jgi:hypothetical protein